MASLELFVVDAFTDVPFGGNPAGVVLCEVPADDSWMQSVAAELRHSETAFVVPRDRGVWDLRWFTPVKEVDLCGHATLATAHVIGGDNVFRTRSGDLACTVDRDGWVHMDFPADPATGIETSDDLARAVGGATIVAAGTGLSDVLVQLETPDEVHHLVPDLETIAEMPVRGLIATAYDPDADLVVSRCFYPTYGVPEDPVTGSAHCTLGSWWCPRLGRESFVAKQLSSRGGTVRVSRQGSRITLAGQAVTVLEGRIRV